MGPDQHRSTLCDDVKCGGEWVDVQWHPDGSQVAFVSTSRNHQQANLRVADAAHRRHPRRARGKGRDVPRVRQRPRQLALSARLERSDLVLAARQLGPALSARSADRQAEARRSPAATATSRSCCASTRPTRTLYFQGVGKEARPRSVLPSLLPRRHGRQARAAADAGRRRSRRLAVAVGQVLRRQLLEARCAVDLGAARRRPARWCCRSRRWTSAGCSRPAGSRRCRSR